MRTLRADAGVCVAFNLVLMHWSGYREGVLRRHRPEPAEAPILSTRLLVCVAITLVAAAAVDLSILVQSLRVLPVVAGFWAAGDVIDRMAHDAAGTKA